MNTHLLSIFIGLIGGSVAFAQTHPPVVPPAPPTANSINKSVLKSIEDDAPARNETENADESRAYDYIVGFAHMVPEASFRSTARTDLTFAHLLGPEAAKHRGEVVLIEGRLKRVRDLGPTPSLAADGIQHLYEGWIFSEIYREYAYCVLFTELPPGVTVSEQLDLPVSFAGYFYKIYRYKAGDGFRRSPLLVGRTIALLPKPRTSGIWDITGRMLPVTCGIIAVGVFCVFGLAWWFRRSDRLAREAVQRARGMTDSTSPFED